MSRADFDAGWMAEARLGGPGALCGWSVRALALARALAAAPPDRPSAPGQRRPGRRRRRRRPGHRLAGRGRARKRA